MALTPSFEDFEATWKSGTNQLVWTRLAADLDTPVSLMLKLAEARTDSFILESVTGGEVRGRYSIIGMKPDLVWECRGATSRINRQARFERDEWADCDGDPLSALRALIAESRIDIPEGLPPASAGLFGYLGYDMIRLVEHLPNVNPDPLGLPDAVMLRPSVIAVLDGVKGEVIVVAPAWASSGLNARAAYAQAAERVMDAVRDLERAATGETRDLGQAGDVAEPVSNFAHADYLAAVDKARDYIRAGDIFQVVPSQRWAQDFKLPPFALYRSLRRTNPSPFMFYFNFGSFQVIGASPEILVRTMDGEVTIRPIAGTRPRGATPDEDRALEADLLADEKELAEHLMLLDLGRNDVGRVAKIGTVRPTEEFIVERYSHVMHIVSNVVGELGRRPRRPLQPCFAGIARGHGLRRAQGSGDADHRRVGARKARRLRRRSSATSRAGGDMDMCIALQDGRRAGPDALHPGRRRRGLRQRPAGGISWKPSIKARRSGVRQQRPDGLCADGTSERLRSVQD